MKITYQKALEFAAQVHEGQLRKKSKLPYITHPLRVVDLALTQDHAIMAMGLNAEDLKIVAILHDVIEDAPLSMRTDVILFIQDLKENIKEALWLLTKKGGEDYFSFIKRMIEVDNRINYYAIIVKMADLYHNMSDLEEGSLKDKYRFAFDYLLKKTSMYTFYVDFST